VKPRAIPEFPDRIVRDGHTSLGQRRLQAMQRQVRVLGEPLHNDITMRFEYPLAMAAHLAGTNRSGRTMALRSFHN